MAAVSYEHLLNLTVPKAYSHRLVFTKLGGDATFRGSAKVTLDVLEPSHTVALHAKDIEVLKASAKKEDGTAVELTSSAVHAETDTVRLTFASELQGLVTISLKYTAIIRKPLSGAYHCSFSNGSSGVSTHFEPTYARYALPCIDEPKAKATFQMYIVAPKELTVLSNMPEVSTWPADKEGEGLVEHVFEQTPRMSSYLVGFSIGEWGRIELPKEETPVPMALYADKGQEHLGAFALDIAAKSLRFFEEFFNSKFPLPKLDIVVPPDFPISGMENWGIITLTNRSLLDESASLTKKQNVGVLVAHEVSHMWFGDLVTPCWWDDLWLKEGFASWVEYLPLDAHFPGWRVWDNWALATLYRSGGAKPGALEIDQFEATHAVEAAVNHPDEVQELFDSLSYNKGSAMVNMLFHFLGQDAFRTGLTAWLDKFKNGNSTTADLWASLAEASGKPVAEIMATWTRQEGFPVLSVAAGPDGKWTVSQSRFGLQGCRAAAGEEPEMKKSKTVRLWKTPLPILHPGAEEPEPAMVAEERVEIARHGDWVLVNSGVRAPLRVHYSPELLRALGDEAARDGTKLAPIDRAALIDDAYAMARAGKYELGQVLDLLSRVLPSEKDPLVWCGALSVVRRMMMVFRLEAPALRAFVSGLVVPQKARLGWFQAAEGEADDDTLLRPLALSVLGLCCDEDVMEEAVSLTRAYLCNTHAPPPPAFGKISLKAAFSGSACPACSSLDTPQASVRGTSLQVAVMREPAMWPDLVSRYAAETNTEDRDQLLMAIALHSDRKALEDWVAAGIAGAIPSMEWSTLFEGLAESSHNGLAWELLVKHWDAVYGAWGQSQFKMKAIVGAAMGSGVPAGDIEAFFAEHPCDSVRMTVRQQLEGVVADCALRARAAEVEAFCAVAGAA